METANSAYDHISVTDIIYRVSSTGEVLPCLRVRQTRELRKLGYDALLLDSMEAMVIPELGIGAEFEVDFSGPDETPRVKKTVKPSKDFGNFPTNCNACGSEIVEGFCVNNICHAMPRTPLMKIVKIASKETTSDVIFHYLNNYTLSNGSITNIKNIGEFKEIFQSVRVKDTVTRSKQWNDQHLFELDMLVEKYLKRDALPSSDFWVIASLPSIYGNNLIALSKLNPERLVHGIEVLFKALPQGVQEVVKNNMDYIEYLYSFFNSFGKKTWK